VRVVVPRLRLRRPGGRSPDSSKLALWLFLYVYIPTHRADDFCSSFSSPILLVPARGFDRHFLFFRSTGSPPVDHVPVEGRPTSPPVQEVHASLRSFNFSFARKDSLSRS